MPHSIISNKKNLSTVIHFNSNSSLVIAGINETIDFALDAEF